MVADIHPGLRPSRITQRELDDLVSDDEHAYRHADLTCSAFREAFEEAEAAAAELPSFRPLVRGMPAPRHAARPVPRDIPSRELNTAVAPLPFSRARALAANDAPLVATSRVPPGRAAPTRRVAFRSARPFLLAVFFLAGTVAGLGGAFAGRIDRLDDGAIEQARATLTSLAHWVAWRRLSGSGDAAALPVAAAPIATAHPLEAVPKALPSTVEVSLSPADGAMTARAESAVPVEKPAPAAPAIAPAVMLALERGDEAMTRRDVFAARRWYEFAASAGVAGAASAVARTYDPVYLQQLGVRGVRPDIETALRWYQRAREEEAAAARPR